MRIALYGGSFNPPHLGHASAARAVCAGLSPDRFLIMPDNIPPHKEMEEGSPTARQRLALCQLAFRDVPGVEISDMELERSGRSYTADTVAALRERYPTDELVLVMGSDMLLSFEQWYRFDWLLKECRLAVLSREDGDSGALEEHAEKLRQDWDAKIDLLPHTPLPMSSSQIRQDLRRRGGTELLDGEVYAAVIRNGYYGAMPNLAWLREQSYARHDPRRVSHVAGCEQEAARLAERWGADQDKAAEAGILHDITKKLNFDQQLHLCRKYAKLCGDAELAHPRILHAITGAALARELFGIDDDIYGAIRWHTTGKPDMTLLEKILYLADYIEPTRDFPGVEGPRELAYTDIDAALALALGNTLEELRQLGEEPFEDTVKAYQWYMK